MTKIHEYQGKKLLSQAGIAIPSGDVAQNVEEARAIAAEIGGPVVVKAQAWITGRAGRGAIRFADTPDEAAAAAETMLGMRIGQFTVDRVLVEEKIAIEREFYAGVILDDTVRAPVMVFSSIGGTGIEDIAREHPNRIARHTVDIRWGLRDFEARELARKTGISGKLLLKLGDVLPRLYHLAKNNDARAAEINPLVVSTDGKLIAADCRVTVDDYAVFRHPEIGIDMARELDRPPTALERIAWEVERSDYRGTFFFIQMNTDFRKNEGVIGFHGAGGGGSMMNMDALHAENLQIANFVDTSGNPPASKVYRAARIILSQRGIDGYFASGSGVASQEQFHSARALVKAFLEEPLTVPAVIRLGGNAEEQAIAILKQAREHLAVPLEAYGKDDSPAFCAARMRALIETAHANSEAPEQTAQNPAHEPAHELTHESTETYTFETVSGGTVMLDHARCRDCANPVCVEQCAPQILILEDGLPVLAISREDARRGDCTECLACEVECYFHGNRGGYVHLPIEGLDAYRAAQSGGTHGDLD